MGAGSSKVVQTFKAENVQAGQLFGICVYVTARRASHFFLHVVYQCRNIHLVETNRNCLKANIQLSIEITCLLMKLKKMAITWSLECISFAVCFRQCLTITPITRSRSCASALKSHETVLKHSYHANQTNYCQKQT